MSLINKVLEDIERNRPASDADLSTDVRVAARAPGRSRMPVAIAVVAAAGGALIALALAGALPRFGSGSARPQPSATPLAAAAPTVVRAVETVVAAAAVTPATLARPAPSAEPLRPAPPSAPVIAVPSAPVAAAPKAPAPAAPPPALAPAVVPAPTPLALPPVAKSAAAAAGPTAAAPPAAQAPIPAAAPQPVPVAVAAAVGTVAAPPQDQPVKTVSPQQQSENLYREAIVLLQQGRPGALALLEKSLQTYPRNAAARKALANSLMQRGANDAAFALLEEGRNLSPDDVDLTVGLARIELERANPQRAQDLLEDVARAGKADAATRAMQAVALQRLGRHADAVAHFIVALQANPSMPQWLVGLGISLRATGREAEALEAFDRARASGLLSQDLAAFVEQQMRAASANR